MTTKQIMKKILEKLAALDDKTFWGGMAYSLASVLVLYWQGILAEDPDTDLELLAVDGLDAIIDRLYILKHCVESVCSEKSETG